MAASIAYGVADVTRVGVAETWLCDLVAERLEVYARPTGGAYVATRTLDPGARVVPAAFADVVVPVDDLRGPPPATPSPGRR